jgi:hypothetical protein
LWADLRWMLFQWQLTAQQRGGEKLPFEQAEAHTESFIRSILREIPYWGTGHLWVAKRALTQNHVELAYASAQAVLILGQPLSCVGEARRLLARCQMKVGDYAGAGALLRDLLRASPQWWEVREDFAALLIHEGDFKAAAAELGSIPVDQLSGEGKAALEFARGKTHPPGGE